MSHVNQAYNQQQARNHKKVAAETLYDLHKVKQMDTGKKHINQYDLVLVGITIVNGGTPEIWETLFCKVNLDSRKRVNFAKWCKKISHFL